MGAAALGVWGVWADWEGNTVGLDAKEEGGGLSKEVLGDGKQRSAREELQGSDMNVGEVATASEPKVVGLGKGVYPMDYYAKEGLGRMRAVEATKG